MCGGLLYCQSASHVVGNLLAFKQRQCNRSHPRVPDIYVYIHTYVIHTYTRKYIHKYIHAYIIHTHTPTYIHTYIHTYTHTHTLSLSLSLSLSLLGPGLGFEKV
jgi:hypothetical protein